VQHHPLRRSESHPDLPRANGAAGGTDDARSLNDDGSRHRLPFCNAPAPAFPTPSVLPGTDLPEHFLHISGHLR
jgi:hypothetical protein